MIAISDSAHCPPMHGRASASGCLDFFTDMPWKNFTSSIASTGGAPSSVHAGNGPRQSDGWMEGTISSKQMSPMMESESISPALVWQTRQISHQPPAKDMKISPHRKADAIKVVFLCCCTSQQPQPSAVTECAAGFTISKKKRKENRCKPQLCFHVSVRVCVFVRSMRTQHSRALQEGKTFNRELRAEAHDECC